MATYTVPGEWDGMVAPWNIDLDSRPVTNDSGYITRSTADGLYVPKADGT